MARTIESPGVEFSEIDLTLTQNLPIGTNILTMGFTPQGPTDEIINVTSVSEFEQIYGLPTTAAERYLYHTAKQVLQSPGNLLVTRLPYGSGNGVGYGNDYSALLYPVVPVTNGAAATGTSTFSAADTFYLGEPIHVRLSNAQYTSLSQNSVNWLSAGGGSTALPSASALGSAGLIVVNDAKTIIDDYYAGFYIGISDNTTINPATTYNSITGIYTVDANNAYFAVDPSRLTFSLTQPVSGIHGSTSELIESVPSYDFNAIDFDDSIILTVFKVRPSLYAQDPLKLDQVLTEAYVGSFDSTRKVSTAAGGQPASFFIENVVNSRSANIRVYVNPNLSNNIAWTGPDGHPLHDVRVNRQGVFATDSNGTAARNRVVGAGVRYADNLYALGNFTSKAYKATKDVGIIPQKIERALALAENSDIVPLDITLEAGLGTIWAAAHNPDAGGSNVAGYFFDETLFLDTTALVDTSGAAPSGPLFDDYTTVFQSFQNFAENTRRDHLFISDPLRHIFVNGPDSKVMKNVNSIFSANIYWALRNLYSDANTSYAASYGNWGKVYDPATDKYCWVPLSGHIGAMLARIDANSYPWIPSGGLTRGILSGIVELAITPTQKQRDLLYRAGINPITFFPNDGYVVMGQKTLLRAPSAFNRINVRRLFTTLEKSTQAILRYFVMEPNTVFTRTRLRNTVTPILSTAKTNSGVYDYLIICDERNNTGDVIDRGEIQVDIYLKPVRAGEFVLVNFIATRTSQNFSELI